MLCYNYVKSNVNGLNILYPLQSAGWFHGENADKKTPSISSTTRKKLCQGQTEVVREIPADLRPATEGSLN